MNILITGAAGYLGTQLCRALSDDHNITAVDSLIFNQGHLVHSALNNTEVYRLDTQDIYGERLDGFDAFIPLSCLVGMPICRDNPELAKRTNLDDIVRIANEVRPDCKIIIPSTNSGYGTSTSVCDETTPLSSVSLYGKLKEELEEKILARGNAIVFRLATVFGLSDRPRLQLLVNTLTYDAYFNKKIKIFDNGFMRNYIHVQDVIGGFLFGLYNFDKMRDNVYNLGNDALNCTKEDLAKAVQFHLPESTIENMSGNDPDKRDYQVSSDKIYKLGYKPQYNLDWGIDEMIRYYSYLPQDEQLREQIILPMQNDKFRAER